MRITSLFKREGELRSSQRLLINILGGLVVLLSIICLKLTFKEPVVIAGICHYEWQAPLNEQQRSDLEIREFLAIAIPSRFNTTVKNPEYLLSREELDFRNKEQSSNKSKNIVQRVLVNQVEITDSKVVVYTDRLIEINEIKGAPITFDLEVTIEKTWRSPSNPWGLKLSQVKQHQKKEKDHEP